MRNNLLSLRFLYIVGTFILFSPVTIFAQYGNRPPEVRPIHAELNPPTTVYSVSATDPDGDPLNYSWQGIISCGEFHGGSGLTASWDHPEGDPPMCHHADGTNHKGTILVSVSDGAHTVICSYDGSESGDGTPCGFNEPVSYSGNTNNNGDGWIVVLAGIIFLGWWINKNGLFITEIDDPCAREKAAEAAARARMEEARRAFNEIDRIKNTVNSAEKRAKEAEKAAEKAAQVAGGRWSAHGSTDWEGEHIEVHKEGWQNKELGKKADDAIAGAKNARDEAKKAKNEFGKSGGNNAWNHFKDEFSKATSEWEKANEALRLCMLKPKPQTPTTPTTTATPNVSGPVTTDDHKTTTVNVPPVEPPETKKPRLVCIPGERRNETTKKELVELLDLQSARLMQDKIYSDVGNEAMKFVDWLQTIKDVFLMGKAMKGGVEGYLDKSLDGAADAVGLPDFLTWYDKAVDELTKSMYKLYQIMQDKQKLGYYWIEYTAKKVELTCLSYEVCEDNRWVKHCEFSIQEKGTRTGRTDPEDLFDVKELQPVIRKLFTKLRNRFNGDKEKAKRFADSCNKCL